MWLANRLLALAGQDRTVRPGEALALFGIALVAAALFAFIAIADAVFEGETQGFDRALMLALRDPANPANPIGPRWLREVARDITALGGTFVLTFTTLALAGFLAMSRQHAAALLVLVAVGGGTLISTLLKHGFERARPDIVPHAMDAYSASFPSGHSMLSAVTWLTLGALLMRIEPRKRVKSYVLALAVATTLMVGASRVYLGVHWPTDVLAGWSLGAGWALLCWIVALWLQQRGQVEAAPIPPEDEAG